jgi:hypothetical protein
MSDKSSVPRMMVYPLLSSKLGNEPQEAEYSLRSRGEPSRAWVIGYGEDAGMAKADYRTKARECYRMAAMAPSPADQATWLKLASEWLAMSSGRGVPVLTGSTVVKREAAQTTTSDDLLVRLSV